MFSYYRLEEIGQKTGMSIDQILRLGCSGTIIFSILDHQLKNYEEKDEVTDQDGELAIRTRVNEEVLRIGVSNPTLRLSYISQEDVINIVTNEAPNRKTLVRTTYQTRELDPKKGTWQANNPKKLAVSDLVISDQEWEIFSNGKGKKIKNYLPLALPEKVTIPWLFKNVSYDFWLLVVSWSITLFSAGLYFSGTNAYKALTSLFQSSAP